MKYILVLVLMLASFLGGIYFENDRLVGEPGTTIAVFLSKQAKDNSNYQQKELSSYLELIGINSYHELERKIRVNLEIQKEISRDASNFCKENPCNSEQSKYIEGKGRLKEVLN